MKIEVWSDVVCPWCYVGKRNLEAALRSFSHRDDVEVTWRSFELDPAAPRRREGGYAGRLATKYGVALDEAQQMIDRMTTAAAAAGLAFRFDIAQPGNSFDAHRLIHLGREHGVQDAVKERFLAATFSEGQPIGEHGTLQDLAVEAGLGAAEVRAVLSSDAFGDQVRADEQAAVGLGITAVPFFAIDRAYGVAGAQPPAVLRQALDQAWATGGARAAGGGADGAGCGGDACAS